jgi:ribonucleoside-diphosphate reductase alpha chain
VGDSREGWAKAFEEVLEALWEGHSIDVDYSKVRPRGARLKTMGGRASGPEPLKNLFDFASKLFGWRCGSRLQPLDCHDLICKVAEIVVVGGVRRSSLISLSDLNDKQIATAKSGEFWTSNPHRSMSNNSAVYAGRPDMASFMREWIMLIESGSGERGIFNRVGAVEQMKASGRREAWKDLGTNPCAEILLRDAEFCNLTEVVVRPNDNLDSLREKVRLATALGMWQATMTKFPYIRQQWRKNCEEERLLGVSLSGIMDNPVLNNINDKAKKWFADLKHTAIHEAKKWSKILEINMPAAITCVKPSGTVSQLVDCASGIHPRYAPYYTRRVRISATDPLFSMLRDQGVPCSPELGQEAKTASTWVLEFPVASPKNAKTRCDFTALEQLEHWKMVKEFWCEHNPSITVYVDDSEWLDVGAWVYRNFDYVTGISFLPKQNHVYLLAPYEEIDEDAYMGLKESFPKIDYSQLSKYENEDNTEGAKTYACVGDSCETG